jgi:diguanylate cyclase
MGAWGNDKEVQTLPPGPAWLAAFLVVLALAFMMALVEHVHRIERDRALEILHGELLDQAAAMRSRLEAELNASLFIASGLVGYVAAYDDWLEHDRVMTALEVIHGNARHVRNVALAPDNVIVYMFPREGNEEAIGLDYRRLETQWPAVEQAMLARHSVLAGPVDLIQGGIGLINRTPVYLQDGRYWGLLSVVIDVDSLFTEINFDQQVNTKFALRSSNAGLETSTLIRGHQEVFDVDPLVVLRISVPGGNWELGVAPVAGWDSAWAHLHWYRLGGHLGALLVAALLFLVLAERRRIARMALHDQLTGLANRRQFHRYLRRQVRESGRLGQSFALLYIDLDGFKVINDRYGHGRGDQILVMLSQRMMKCLRTGAFLARIGGDEFVVVLPGVDNAEDARCHIQPLVNDLRKPIPDLPEDNRLDATIGVAVYPDDAFSADELVLSADADMYRVKREKREPLATGKSFRNPA